MIVSAESRIVRATSFGVFWRCAPSTRWIIRSRKLSPGFEVIRTMIRSDTTRLPPVTALRSPPASRITGADSPVMADSSTEATPSITSPSPGMISPALTMTTSSFLSSSAGTTSSTPSSLRRFAIVCVRVFRSASAWALPLPSAMASAKLANSTVNHNQTDTCRPKPNGSSAERKRSPTVVRDAPTSVTNITGFFIIVRGCSFRNEAMTAFRRIAGSKRECFFLAMGNSFSEDHVRSNHQEMLDDGSKGKGREEGQHPDDQDRAYEQDNESNTGDGKGSSALRNDLLSRQVPREGENGHHEEEPTDQHGDGQRCVVPGSVCGQSGEGAPVVGRGGGEGVQDLAESVRTGVVH